MFEAIDYLAYAFFPIAESFLRPQSRVLVLPILKVGYGSFYVDGGTPGFYPFSARPSLPSPFLFSGFRIYLLHTFNPLVFRWLKYFR